MLEISATSVVVPPGDRAPLGGHHGLERLPREAPHGDLEINVVAFGVGGEAVVLVSIDTLFVGAPVRDAVLDACRRRFGVGPERVLVLASHSHSAPMLDPSKPGLGRADPGEISRWAAAAAAAVEAASPMSAAVARTGSVTTDLSVNRRRRWPWPTLVRLLGKTSGEIYLADNPAGRRDPRIRVALWQTADRTPLALAWSFACHPTGFPIPDSAGPDYVGVVRDALRVRLGGALPVIFAPGCMGDVRPRSPAPRGGPGALARLMIYGPQPGGFDAAGWRAWADGVASAALQAFEAGEERSLADAPAAAPMVRLPIDRIFHGETPVPELQAKALRIPGLGRIVSLSCEPVTDVAALLGAAEGDLVLGYEGDVFGYLPTGDIRREGGYEAQRFMPYFGLSGEFRADLDREIRLAGAALLDRI